MRLLSLAVAVLAAAAPAAAQQIEMPARVVAGGPVPVRVTGLPPGVAAHIEAERSLGGDGRVTAYRSRASFVAGPDGTIDLASAVPTAGDYAGADPAGLFWSMRPVRDAAVPPAVDTARLSVRVGDAIVAQRVVELPPGDPRVQVDAIDAFPGARLYRLPGDRRRPVIIILGGSEGGSSFGRALGPVLASQGYAALALPYYSPDWGRGREIPALPADFADIPVDRLAEVRNWIARQPGLEARRIGLLGISKGGEFAIIAASRFAWLKAVAAIVPSDVVWEGWGPSVGADDSRSSFAWRGRPLAYVPYVGMRAALSALARGERRGLRAPHDDGRGQHPERIAAAAIPIERYRGALLVAGGDRDRTWASGAMARSIGERRARAGLKTIVLSFPDAGHGLGGSGWEPANFPGADDNRAATAKAQAAVRAATMRLFADALRP